MGLFAPMIAALKAASPEPPTRSLLQAMLRCAHLQQKSELLRLEAPPGTPPVNPDNDKDYTLHGHYDAGALLGPYLTGAGVTLRPRS